MEVAMAVRAAVASAVRAAVTAAALAVAAMDLAMAEVDEDGSGFILISERSCAKPGRDEKRIACANTMQARIDRKANCRVIITILPNINYLPNIK